MTTSLEILNHCLSVLGEAPQSSYESTHPSALTSRVVIDGESKELQSRGWWFNKEYSLSLSPDISGEIILPSDTLEVIPLKDKGNLVRRNGKLYDPINHTYTIGAAVIVDITLLLDIEDLPEMAANYVKHKSAYKLYVNDDGDEQKARRLDRDQAEARAKLMSAELKQLNINSNNRTITAQLLSRGYGRTYSPDQIGGGV